MLNLNHKTLKVCYNSSNLNDSDFDTVWKKVLINRLEKFNLDFVGITCMFTKTNRSTVMVSNEIKKLNEDFLIALVGVHITNACGNIA